MDPEPFDVLAVELSSYQLHWSRLAVRAVAAAVLNVARDHLAWHGRWRSTPRPRAGSTSAARSPASTTSRTRRPSRWSRRPTWSRAAGRSASRSGIPAVGMVGRRRRRARRPGVHRGPLTSAPPSWRAVDRRARPAPHNVANALAAAALARSFGVSPAARPRRAARRSGWTGTGSRRSAASTASRYVDDSKATNPHAALASLQAFDPVVWIAGGLAKGATFDELVQSVGDRLRGVVLLGARPGTSIAEALARHAPDVPVIEVRRHGHWGRWSASSTPRPVWPRAATPCCWRRRARPWTCSRTMPHARRRLRRGRATGSRPADSDVGQAEEGGPWHDQRPRRAAAARRRHRRGASPALKRTSTSRSRRTTCVLGVSALLLALGLLMVLSASSVSSCASTATPTRSSSAG